MCELVEVLVADLPDARELRAREVRLDLLVVVHDASWKRHHFHLLGDVVVLCSHAVEAFLGEFVGDEAWSWEGKRLFCWVLKW